MGPEGPVSIVDASYQTIKHHLLPPFPPTLTPFAPARKVPCATLRWTWLRLHYDGFLVGRFLQEDLCRDCGAELGHTSHPVTSCTKATQFLSHLRGISTRFPHDLDLAGTLPLTEIIIRLAIQQTLWRSFCLRIFKQSPVSMPQMRQWLKLYLQNIFLQKDNPAPNLNTYIQLL